MAMEASSDRENTREIERERDKERKIALRPD